MCAYGIYMYMRQQQASAIFFRPKIASEPVTESISEITYIKWVSKTCGILILVNTDLVPDLGKLNFFVLELFLQFKMYLPVLYFIC